MVPCLLLCFNVQAFPARVWEMVQRRGLSCHNSGWKSVYGHVAKPLLYISNAVRPAQDILVYFCNSYRNVTCSRCTQHVVRFKHGQRLRKRLAFNRKWCYISCDNWSSDKVTDFLFSCMHCRAANPVTLAHSIQWHRKHLRTNSKDHLWILFIYIVASWIY